MWSFYFAKEGGDNYAIMEMVNIYNICCGRT